MLVYHYAYLDALNNASIRLSTLGTMYPRFHPPIHAWNPVSTFRSAYPCTRPCARPCARLDMSIHAKMRKNTQYTKFATTGVRNRCSGIFRQVHYSLDHCGQNKKKILHTSGSETTTCSSRRERTNSAATHSATEDLMGLYSKIQHVTEVHVHKKPCSVFVDKVAEDRQIDGRT